MDAMHPSLVLRCLCVLALVSVCCRAFELQDTIHALIEENIHLHDQLENLTAALRELRQLLFHQNNDHHEHEQHEHEHDADLHHLWEEWSQHSVTPEARVLLEHALCGHDLNGSASATDHTSKFLTIAFIILTHLLL